MSRVKGAEVIIVGGGVIGTSIAFHLSSRGVADILLLEREHLAAGATGICPGGIRQQFSSPEDCQLARRSYLFWDHINEILEPTGPFRFEKSGYLFLADSQRQLESYRANVRLQNSLGIPSRLLSTDDLHKLLPSLRLSGVVGASYCAEDGFIEDCHGVTNEFARHACRNGMEVRFKAATRVAPRQSGWEVATDDLDGPLLCDHLVLANGQAAVDLLEPLGLRPPIVDEPRRLAFTTPCEEVLLPPLLVSPERGFAGKQLSNGVFYLGWLRETPDQEDLDFLERGLSAGSSFLPVLERLPVRRILRGRYDTTPDHRPILGAVGGFPGLHLATGFSGHGFMIAPAVGEGVAASLLGDESSLPMAAFTIQRFSAAVRSEGLVI